MCHYVNMFRVTRHVSSFAAFVPDRLPRQLPVHRLLCHLALPSVNVWLRKHHFVRAGGYACVCRGRGCVCVVFVHTWVLMFRRASHRVPCPAAFGPAYTTAPRQFPLGNPCFNAMEFKGGSNTVAFRLQLLPMVRRRIPTIPPTCRCTSLCEFVCVCARVCL